MVKDRGSDPKHPRSDAWLDLPVRPVHALFLLAEQTVRQENELE